MKAQFLRKINHEKNNFFKTENVFIFALNFSANRYKLSIRAITYLIYFYYKEHQNI